MLSLLSVFVCFNNGSRARLRSLDLWVMGMVQLKVQLYGSVDVFKRKRINTLGSNGRPLLCRSCGSYRHLVANSDSLENMNKLKVHKQTII